MTIHCHDKNAGPALRYLAILALCACAPLPRGTTQPMVHKNELQGAFAQCEPAELIEERPGQYYVLACDQVAIYQCEDGADPGEALCTRLAAGDPANVLPQDRSPKARKRRADQLFELGRELDKDGRHLEACDLFAESHALSPTFGSTLNLGDCEKNSGHAEAAWTLYSAAAVIAEDHADERLARSARSFAASLAATKLCTLVITIPNPDAPGLTVHVGDREIPPAATIHTAAMPPELTVTAASPDAPHFRQTARCTAGATVAVSIPPSPQRAAAPVRHAAASPARPTARAATSSSP